MNKIVLDLEFTKVLDKELREICKEEIIQFGAVKLNAADEKVSEFVGYVKPAHTVLSSKVSKLTHITEEMLENADGFAKVFAEFLDWVGEEAYQVYSWSLNDLDVVKGEVALENVSDKRVEVLFENWVDLQAIIGQIIGISQSLSLVNVLRAANETFEGLQHSAIVDAENTAKLVSLVSDEEELNRKLGPVIEMFQPSEPLMCTMGDLFKGICITC